MKKTRGDLEAQNSLTFETAPRYLTSAILEEERAATRRELEILFQRHVLGCQIPQHCLDYFKDNELARMVCQEIYRASVVVRRHNSRTVITQLSQVLGNHIKTIEGWVKVHQENET